MITILASDAYAWICIIAVFFFCLGVTAHRNNLLKRLITAGKEANLKRKVVTVTIKGNKGQKVNLYIQPGGDI